MERYLNSNNTFNVLDLFAGCGGLSEGFINSGFNVTAYLEKNKWACETLKARILFHELKKRNNLALYHKYVKGDSSYDKILMIYPELFEIINTKIISKEFGVSNRQDIISSILRAKKFLKHRKINVLLGGPPCQAYSLIGRSSDINRMQNDYRNFLYQYYLDLIEELRPDFFVFENVPGLISAKLKDESILQKILIDFKKIKPEYNVAPSYALFEEKPQNYLLNSRFFGVPQSRNRVILIGYKKKLLKNCPSITNIFKELLKLGKDYKLTVKDAISDLPAVKPGEGYDNWYSDYRGFEAKSGYQKQMRKNSTGFLNHKARSHMKSDIERYKYFIESYIKTGQKANLQSLLLNKPELTPAHNHLDKFFDRFKVQWWNEPSSTIMAHISKDGHYYIHPDIKQCRSFTVREAARCQSFPDNYLFCGPRTEQFKQVGNAVPPLLSMHIAQVILNSLRTIYK